MKQVIGGKLYNTETAEELHSWDNGMYQSDFARCEETLYRTKRGAFFIHGDGGPLSSYAVSVGNNGMGGSEQLRPLTAKEALVWLERHDGSEVALEVFSDVVEEA